MTNFTSRYADLLLSHSNPLGSLLTRALFARTEFKAEDRDRLALAAKGVPLYIMRTSNDLDFLLVMNTLRREHLPEPTRVLPGESLLIRPVNGFSDLAARFLLGKGEDHQAKLLSESVAGGSPALLSLFSAGPFFDPEERPRAVKALFHLLSRLRGDAFTPRVYAVPVIPVWDKSGVRRSLDEWGILEKFVGSQESPGRARAAMQMALSLFTPVLKTGTPVDLHEYLEAHPHESTMELTKQLRLELLDDIERSWRSILGPRLPATELTRRELARDPKVIDAYFEAVDGGLTPRQALKEIREAISEIPAAPTSTTLSVYKHSLRFVWYRIFRGFELDDEGFERMRDAQSRGPLLLLPCHRSHIDYLILSWIMDRYHLPIPYIAAGQNLSFFPMGPIFRRGGAFFIKRSFKGNKLYKTVLLQYMARLFNDGINVEFFPEGTRSRTGKSVYPKQGLLSMIAELLARGDIPSPQVVPISIGYEKVIEEDAYQAELAGMQKKSEDFLQVIKSVRVLLNRYGRVNVRVADPFDMREFMGDLAAGTPEFSARVEEMAVTIISRIIGNTLITSSMLTAAALLSSGTDSVDKGEAFSRFLFFRRVATARGAHLAATLTDEKDQLRRFNRSIQGFGSACRVEGNTIHIHRGRRATLAYYRNGFLQVIAPTAIHALAESFESGAYIMYSYLWDALRREFPQLNLLDREAERTKQRHFYDSLNDSGKGHLGLLLPDLIEGQALALEALVDALEPLELVSRKHLTSAMIAHGEKAHSEGSLVRPESMSRSVYGETLELMIARGIIEYGDKGLRCASAAQVEELRLEASARRGILDRIPS